MKPLELTVYIHDEEDHDYQHPLHRFWVSEADVDHYAESKRFTDAELAAEYHQADVNFQRHIWQELSRGEDWTDEVWERIAHPVNTLHRFATLPHYDEVSL